MEWNCVCYIESCYNFLICFLETTSSWPRLLERPTWCVSIGGWVCNKCGVMQVPWWLPWVFLWGLLSRILPQVIQTLGRPFTNYPLQGIKLNNSFDSKYDGFFFQFRGSIWSSLWKMPMSWPRWHMSSHHWGVCWPTMHWRRVPRVLSRRGRMRRMHRR